MLLARSIYSRAEVASASNERAFWDLGFNLHLYSGGKLKNGDRGISDMPKRDSGFEDKHT
jgi:hypothetical protein